MNVSQLLTKSARTYPNNLALAYGSRKLNYAQFNSQANRLANALYRLGIRQGDNIALLQYNNAEAVILSSEFNEALMDCRERLPKVRHFITLAGAGNGLLDYEKLLSQESDQLLDADVLSDDLAWLFYTSGTTGMPKGAMLTHRNLLAMTMNFYADICPGFGPDDVVLHAAPLSHGSGCYALPNIGKV